MSDDVGIEPLPAHPEAALESPSSAEASELLEDTEGNAGVDPASAEAPEFGPDAPCGAATVATIDLGGGHKLFFCADGEGGGGILEVGPLGVGGVNDGTLCADALFEMYAPDNAPTPAEIVGLCPAEAGSDNGALVGSRDAVGASSEPILSAFPKVSQASYCGGSGASNFANERCAAVQGDPLCCDLFVCNSTGVAGYHQRTCSAQLGGQYCFWGREQVASCNGTTWFRAWRKESSGDPWVLSLDYDILTNGWADWEMLATCCWDEDDMRFRGDQVGTSFHRYTTGMWAG